MPKYEKLGWKTFWIFVSEHSKVASTIGLIAIGTSLFSNYAILQFITKYLFIAFAVALVVTIVWAWLEYKRYEFAIDIDALRIKRGVLHREEIAIPYRQMQDVDIERDLLNQLTGTSKLVILTAGVVDNKEENAESEGFIPIIDRKLAERIQTELLPKINIQKTINVA